MELSPTKDPGSWTIPAGTTVLPGPTAANPLQTTELTVWPGGQEAGIGNCAPGPGLRVPPDKEFATAPKSTLLRATLEAEPMNTAYCAARFAKAGVPVTAAAWNKLLTAAACGPVS